uniref:Phage protein n=1 Tax=viral metagenome TaxID=1070528 RepID=A0A6M3J8B1_9ZZZZ
MNLYEKLIDLSHQYHTIVDKILRMDIIDAKQETDEEMIQAKAEFAARSTYVFLAMKQAVKVLEPYFKE